MIIGKVISGGQTGVDQAGLRAARTAGIPTGGTAPRGYLTEKGHEWTLLRSFGLVEHVSEKYPPRTAKNIRESDVTILIYEDLGKGSKLTDQICGQQSKPCFHIRPSEFDSYRCTTLRVWLQEHRRKKGEPLVVNIAGSRESKCPGIGRRTAAFLLVDIFVALNDQA